MKKIISLCIVATVVMSYSLVYAVTVNESLSSGIVRFHIIANSKSEEDNRIKLDVRNYISDKLANSNISPYTEAYTQECERLANIKLKELGAKYTAVAKFERVYIPMKSYKEITLPSGYYNAVRLILGEGEGENWWCVAYPALCFSEEMEGALSQKGTEKLIKIIPQDIYEMITDDVKYRLYIVDLVGKLLEKTSR